MKYLILKIRSFNLMISNQMSRNFRLFTFLMVITSLGLMEHILKAALISGPIVFIIYGVIMTFILYCATTNFIDYLDWDEVGFLDSKFKVKDKECNDLINTIDDELITHLERLVIKYTC